MMMFSRTIIAVKIFALAFAASNPGYALDLGNTVDKVTSSVSRTVSRASKGVGGALSGTSVGVRSSQKDGISVSATSSLLGGTSVDVNALGQDGLATAEAETGDSGTSAGLGVLSAFQLGSLGLSPGLALPGGQQGFDSVTPAYAKALYASLDRLQKHALKLRCGDVLRTPQAFDRELILLCKILAEI